MAVYNQFFKEALGDYERYLIKFSASISARSEGGAFKTLVVNQIRAIPGVITVSYKKRSSDQFVLFVKFLVKSGQEAGDYRDQVLVPAIKKIESLRLTARSKIQNLDDIKKT